MKFEEHSTFEVLMETLLFGYPTKTLIALLNFIDIFFLLKILYEKDDVICKLNQFKIKFNFTLQCKFYLSLLLENSP